MNKTLLLLLQLLSLGCATVDDAGYIYFKKGNKIKGVEPADVLLERMHKEQFLREIMYGSIKTSKLIQCSLLRNQLYAASLSSVSNDEIDNAVKVLEPAYQDNDEAFLKACDEIIKTPIGIKFLAIQESYRSNH